MNKGANEIPIFFAVDDVYIPFLAVAIKSLIDNSKKENRYIIKIMYTSITEENQNKIKKYESDNIEIEFVNVNSYIKSIEDKLYTRDYFSATTYFRLFIPELYPQYDKILYLDSDIVVLDDIAKLYNTEIGDNLVAAAPEDVVQSIEVFKNYSELVVGVVDYKTYFNAGVLLMNLKSLREFKFQEKFMYLLETVKFSVAQDQDYLNRLCKGRVKLFSKNWNREPIGGDVKNREDLHLIHYTLAFKPWHFEDVLFQEYFWKYAKDTEFYEKILEIKANFTEEDRKKYSEGDEKLRELAQKENDCVGDDREYRKANNQTDCEVPDEFVQRYKERVEILQRIKTLEREGKFDIDAENDPPTIILEKEDVDYLKEKRYSKFKNIVANMVGKRFLNELLKDNKLIIKEVKGIENLENIETGAMLTCNHFNPFDSFAIEKVFRMSEQVKKKKLYKVIREGNYTNFPGLYGFFFRNCDTLPLSSSTRTMVEFIKSVDKILQRGDFILIYPEQSLWWNYKKPKPLKNGAFKLASRNNVPVIPIFITMQDSDIMGEDGFPIQEYIINIEKPIYPEKGLSEKENTEKMKEENFEIWKKVYEEFYKTSLEYITENK